MEKYVKCILKDCFGLCFETLVDLVVKYHAAWYQYYCDLICDYYYINGNIYVVITSAVENSRELAEILQQEWKDFCPASWFFSEQYLNGQKIVVTRSLCEGCAEILYTELKHETIFLPKIYKIYYENNNYTIHELDEREF